MAFIIVTIQTFPFVLKAIEDSAVLKEYNYAIIADEAHSSQTGRTAKGLGKMLHNAKQDDATEIEDVIASAKNLSYFAFTATPKSRTIELFGRVPNPELVSSKTNLPQSFHVYSMRQAIEEGFILDVLRNYTNYKTVYQLMLKDNNRDETVDSKRAKSKLKQWVRLHDYNISQRVAIIVEHFKDHVMNMIAGQAKAMVITSSRKHAVRYKLGFDTYIKEKKYSNIHAMVAFSNEVTFTENDPNAEHLLGKKFDEKNMNPNLKGRDMRKAFDSDDYQVMIVANKFQTGFDQPKLCAMYVDKKLRGVDCVQTLSRLNRTYPGKTKTYVLDLCSDNEPEDILGAFQPYYQTAQLEDVSNPDRVYDLFDKLRAASIFQWHEVEQFYDTFHQKSKSNAAIANICKPAVERWNIRIARAINAHTTAKDLHERIKRQTTDAILITNAENQMKDSKKDKNFLEVFKKDLGTYPRFYEFMSQIVNYNDNDLEKLSLYARYLHPMLRDTITDEEIDLNNIQLSHYRLSMIRHQDLILRESTPEYNLKPGDQLGTAKAKNKKEAFLSQIIERLNELFVTDELTDDDLVNYAYTIRDKVKENNVVMLQIANNTSEQAMLGDFPQAVDNAVMDSSEAHQNQMMQLLSDPSKSKGFAKVVFDLLKKII